MRKAAIHERWSDDRLLNPGEDVLTFLSPLGSLLTQGYRCYRDSENGGDEGENNANDGNGVGTGKGHYIQYDRLCSQRLWSVE